MPAARDHIDARPTVAGALEELFKRIKVTGSSVETVSVSDACGRVSAEDVRSDSEIPSFDRAAMDGYALLADDTTSATEATPVTLRVVTKIVAGASPPASKRISKGEAAEIMTGGPLPPGADAVAMKEECARISDRVSLGTVVARLQNVSQRGEDYKKGDVIVKKDRVLRPWHVAGLATAGVSKVAVRPRLRVGVLSTGTELVEVGNPPGPGQIINSNRPMLSSSINELGCRPVDLGIAPDNARLIRRRLRAGLADCDILLTTGGSSVGEKDLVPEAIEALPKHFFVARGLRLRPGGATGVAVVGGKPVFILSGYPVAAFTGFEALVRPTIHRLRGAEGEPLPMIRGRLEQSIANRRGIRSYIRVRVSSKEGGYLVDPISTKGSGLISTLTNAQGILVLDEATTVLEAGEEVEVRLLESVPR